MITLSTDQVRKPRRMPRLRKVYYAHYDHELRAPHPVIRLAGKYLTSYGFAIGDSIDVELKPHQIIITKLIQSLPL
jgi:hypothetical protein